MGQSPTTVHLDTSVLIPMLERRSYVKKYKKDEFRQAQILRKFLLERNFTVKISIVALGELTAMAVRENRLYLLDNLKRFMKKFGDNLKLCYSPRLRR